MRRPLDTELVGAGDRTCNLPVRSEPALPPADLFPHEAGDFPDAPTVGLPVDRALVEGHDVLGEGPGLVTEDVLDLAQLLVQCGGPGLCRSVALGVVHLPVPVDVEAVAQTDDLHTEVGHPHTQINRYIK